jgi:hypothetical protein
MTALTLALASSWREAAETLAPGWRLSDAEGRALAALALDPLASRDGYVAIPARALNVMLRVATDPLVSGLAHRWAGQGREARSVRSSELPQVAGADERSVRIAIAAMIAEYSEACQ